MGSEESQDPKVRGNEVFSLSGSTVFAIRTKLKDINRLIFFSFWEQVGFIV